MSEVLVKVVAIRSKKNGNATKVLQNEKKIKKMPHFCDNFKIRKKSPQSNGKEVTIIIIAASCLRS